MDDKTCLCVGDWNPRTETCTPCSPSMYYDPELPGCNYCDDHYYRDPEDVWECLECEGRVSEDFTECEPCEHYEIWNNVSKECVECEGIVEDDGTCSPCYVDGDEDLWYYDTVEHECSICIGELTADPTECNSCDTNKYFYYPQLECIDCLGTVSNDYETCTPCDDTINEFFETGPSSS